MPAELVFGYFLYINGERVQQFFERFEEATDAAKSHMASKAALKIETTSHIPVKVWNYDYKLDRRVEFFRR